MRIEMIKTRRQTNVPEKVGRVLIEKGIAVEVEGTVVPRQTYLTRDMRAELAAVPTFTAPGMPIGNIEAAVLLPSAAHSTHEPAEEPDPLDDAPVALADPELDAEGAAWNPDLHTADRAMTRAGTWRKKPGAKASA